MQFKILEDLTKISCSLLFCLYRWQWARISEIVSEHESEQSEFIRNFRRFNQNIVLSPLSSLYSFQSIDVNRYGYLKLYLNMNLNGVDLSKILKDLTKISSSPPSLVCTPFSIWMSMGTDI